MLFLDTLRKYTSDAFCGVRVFERHPNRGGLHVHMLCNERFYVGLARRLAAHCGLGRVLHVRLATLQDAEYVAKYVTKDEKIFGVRQWASFGDWESCRNRDLTFTSKGATRRRDCYKIAEGDNHRARWANASRMATAMEGGYRVS